jgi:adenylate cyclase
LHDPPRILAVDDTPENLEILRMRLEANGYEVVTAADGQEAVAKVRSLTYNPNPSLAEQFAVLAVA